MKILSLNRNTIGRRNWGHQLFRNEIARQHEVINYGRGFPNYQGSNISVQEIISKFCNGKVDVLLTYDTYRNVGNPGMGNLKDVLKVNINIDYETNVEDQNIHFKQNKYDLIFGVVSGTVNLMKKYNVCKKIRYLPFSVDTNIYKNMTLPKTNDVCAVYTVNSILYSERGKIHNMLKEMKIKIIINKIIHEDLIQAINKSKIIITSNSIFKSLSMRYTETLACGGFLLADKPNDFDNLGFVDGKHLVLYDGLEDLKNKINYYLKPENEKKREIIAHAGMQHVRKNHSCEVRVKNMIDIIKEEFPHRFIEDN